MIGADGADAGATEAQAQTDDRLVLAAPGYFVFNPAAFIGRLNNEPARALGWTPEEIGWLTPGRDDAARGRPPWPGMRMA